MRGGVVPTRKRASVLLDTDKLASVYKSNPPDRITGFPDKWRQTCGYRCCGTRVAHLRGA